MPAFTKECKLHVFPHEPLQQPKCKQCHAQLAIGGKPTAKVSLRKVRSVNITVGHVNNVATSHCRLLLKKRKERNKEKL